MSPATEVPEKAGGVEEARLNVTVPVEMKRQVEALAGLHQRTAAGEVRIALASHLDKHATGLRYALRAAPELVTVVGEDGRRVVRGVGRGYAEELAASLTLQTGESFEVVPDPGGGGAGAPSTLAAAAA